jgi:hypothetical protein
MPIAEPIADEGETQRALNERLAQLQAAGSSRYELWKRSNDDLCKQLIATYLWWREAHQVEGYLEGQYREKGIKWKR